MPHTKLSVRVAVSGFAVFESIAILCLPFRDKREQTSGLSALLRNIKRCSEDFRVGSAAAQVTADSMLYVVQFWVRIAVQQRRTAHHHARRAKTTLHCVMFHESSLYLVHRVAVRQALDRRNPATDCIDSQCHARKRWGLVDPYRTGGTRAAVANDLGSSQAQVVAQGFGKRITRFDGHRMLMTIDVEFYCESVRANRPIVMQGIFRLAGQCICGLDDGRSCCNASTLQKSATGKLSLGTLCHGNGLSDV